jgi:hypothetical protein
MTEIELHVHTCEDVEPKVIKIASDATVEQLVKAVQTADAVIGELEEDLILLVENEEVRHKKKHKLSECGIKHGHHIHFKKSHYIKVAVVTTSGVWPHEGFGVVPIHQLVKVQLHHAVKKLGIADTTGWIAKVGKKELNIEQSYSANGLSCEVEIDYGPREGGGGNE